MNQLKRMALKMDWKPYRLDQLGYVGRGRSRSRPRNNPALYGGAYPLFETGDIKSADLYLSNPKKTYNQNGLAQSKMWDPGTLCITIAANIAETAILKIRACFPDSVVGFVADPQKADARYVKYYIDFIKLQMQNISHGTTQDNLSVEKLLTFDFFTPPLALQQKIATILSNYDNLIENNTRRIKILEEMAATIYREWFVEFRFPGHENAKMVESELGLIPQGWEVVTASEAISINPKTYVSRDTRKSFVPMKSATEHSMVITEVEERTGNSGTKFKNHDTLFARITPCLENGRTGFVQFLQADDMIALGSTEFVVLRSRTLNPYFVYLLAQTHDFRGNAIKSMTGTTGRQRVVNQCFDDYFLPNPDQNTLCQFECIVAPLFKEVQNLWTKNANLRLTRDLLLPKLTSGELDVSELDIEIDTIQ